MDFKLLKTIENSWLLTCQFATLYKCDGVYWTIYIIDGFCNDVDKGIC